MERLLSLVYLPTSEYQNLSGTSHRLLAGWCVTPELNLTKHFGLQGDCVNILAARL